MIRVSLWPRVRRGILKSSAATAALVVAAISAQAADLGRPYMPFAPQNAYSWTGFYVGVQGSYSWGRDTTTEYLTAGMVPLGLEYRFPTKGFMGGGHAGYNYQFGNVVLGVEADFEGGKVKGNFVDTIQNIGLGSMAMDWQGSVRGRIGYAFDRMMVYGTGGYSFANIDYTYTNRLSGIAETTGKVRDGWTVGAGVEYAVRDNITARLEYRYTNYGSFLFDSVTSFPGITGEQAPTLNSVRAGVSMRF